MASIRANKHGVALFTFLLVVSPLLFLGSSVPIAQAAHASTKTISVGNSPDAVAVDPSQNLIYVANGGDNTVSVINGSTNTIKKTVPVGDDPDAIAVNPSTETVYVADLFDDNVTVINESTNSVVKSFSVGDSPDALALDAAKNTLYVTDQEDNNVSIVNELTNKVIENVSVGDGPDGLAVDPSTNMIYVANAYDATVSVIDGSMNKVVATVPVGNDPADIAVDSATGLVYVANYYDSTISVINGSDNTVVATVSTAGQGPDAIAVDNFTNAVYVAESYNDSVAIIDGATNEAVTNVAVGQSVALAVDVSTNIVYSANIDTNTISVVHGLKQPSQTYVLCSSPVTIGDFAACTALVIGAEPSGPVTWDSTAGGSFVSNGNSSCTILAGECSIGWQPGQPVPSGPVQITATFPGDVNNRGSSGEFQVEVEQAVSATSVVCAPESVAAGSSTTCTASVTGYSPTGQVLWSSNGTASFSKLTCTLSAGICSVSLSPSKAGPAELAVNATYYGDSNNLESWGEGLIRVSPVFPTLSAVAVIAALAVVIGAGLFLIRRRRGRNSLSVIEKKE